MKICKFFMKGKCNDGDKCKFIHHKNICRDLYFNGLCKRGNSCKYKHEVNGIKFEQFKNKSNKKKKRNTESFEPSHKSPDMRIIVDSVEKNSYNYSRKYRGNDVIIVNNLFCDKNDLTIYKDLLKEIKNSGINEDNLWKLWHGDTHFIVDDKLKWKEKCPTFMMVIDKIREYFQVDIKATRFNLYEDSLQWKPFHHDAAAVKKDKAKIQNITIGVSFGLEREAAFEHAKTKTVVSMSLPNGSIYIFNRDVNVDWRHGILQMNPDNVINQGRISIIVWGKVDMV